MEKDGSGSIGYRASPKEPEDTNPLADEQDASKTPVEKPAPDPTQKEMPESQAAESEDSKPDEGQAADSDSAGEPAKDTESAAAEAGEAHVEWEGKLDPGGEPPRPAAKKKKTRKSSRKKPSEQEMFQRLMEKNEVILQLSKKNVELEAKHKALHDKRVQLSAEFENYRKRTRKEWELLKEQTKAEVIVEILPIVDDFERAQAALEDQSDEFVQGIRLIYNNLLATLAKFGVTKLIALGEAFDPNYHMAVASIDTQEVESNHVVEVIQEGYLLDGSVIRPANVVIAK